MTPTLRSWLDVAWQEHGNGSDGIAQTLLDSAATLPDDADGADAVRLAEHVLLAHRADTAALRRFLAALSDGGAATSALAPGVQRAHWALAVIDGTPPEPLPDAQRWRALHGVVMALVLQGRTAAARAHLLAEEQAAADSADAEAQKAYAAAANNTAQDLRLGVRGDAARDGLMREAAALARRAWGRAGTWLHVQRADYQLAMCHAVLGEGEAAVRHAGACLARCRAEAAGADELFFARECNVHAERAAGRVAAADEHRAAMAALLDRISDDGLRAFCSQTLATTPGTAAA